MMSESTYLDELKKLLAEDERLVNKNGQLLKSRITELAQNLDEKLISILLENTKMNQLFFKNISDTKILDLEKFLEFVHNEAYLSDSYTAFKNKIGLSTSRNDYISERSDVVLNWPYKDCVLEGGQDKDDQKRDEVFWNETLGADQRDVLLAPKTLSGFRRYDKEGEHDVQDLSEEDNYIIRGNNLLALHTLKKRYAQKVKLIYIDPPYNTGKDEFGYNDRFSHSTWLTFMKNRVEIAWSLLRNDGFLFVHCDDNEQQYLKVLLDSVINRKNYVSMITVKANPAGKQSGADLAIMADYVLVYKKSSEASLNGVPLNEEDEAKYNRTDKQGKFLTERLRQHGVDERREDSPNLYYPIYFQPETKDITLEEKEEYVKVLPILPSGGDGRWIWGRDKVVKDKALLEIREVKRDGTLIWDAYFKKYYSEDLRKKTPTIWADKKYRNEVGTKELRKLFGTKDTFAYPKSEFTIMDILETATDPNDLVLDYHLGSGTTAAVAHKMGRRYIGVEQLDYGKNDPVMRLRKVVEGEKTGISEIVGWKGGGSFVYSHLKNDVNIFIQKIKGAQAKKEVESLLQTVLSSNFLSHRVDPEKFEKDRFAKLALSQQKLLLIDLINKNKLYVNYHDIDDSSYKIDATTKKLNVWMQSRD
jgi:adenine-specific DNA-methyltransferase